MHAKAFRSTECTAQRWLSEDVALKVPGSKHSLCTGFFKNSVHPAVSGYLTLFRAGEGEGGEDDGWHTTMNYAGSKPGSCSKH